MVWKPLLIWDEKNELMEGRERNSEMQQGSDLTSSLCLRCFAKLLKIVQAHYQPRRPKNKTSSAETITENHPRIWFENRS